MKTFIQIISSVIFITFSTASAFAQVPNEKLVEQIMRLEDEYLEASKTLSAESFEKFYAPDFIVTVRIPPRIVTNEQRLKTLKDPNFKRGTTESLTQDDLKVRIYSDNTAIVTGAWKRISKDADGKDTSASGRFTHIWVKQGNRWLLAGAHYSPDIDLEKLKAGATTGAVSKDKKIEQ